MKTIDRLTVAEARLFATSWLDEFAAALESGDALGAASLFLPHGYWRDLLALTWDLRTFAGPEAIAAGLKESLAARRVSAVRLDSEPDAFERKNWGWTIEAFFTFETDIATCRGHLRLLAGPAGGPPWEALTVLTSMDDLIGFEEQCRAHRPTTSSPHGPATAHPSPFIAPRYEPEEPDEPAEPAVLVIGAGQAGLTVATRLGQLGVDTLVVEREERVGDNWRHRYQSLVLHNQVWANHFPYLPFPSSWPIYISKEQLADWLEMYATILPLKVWTSTRAVESTYDDVAGHWTVTLEHSDGSIRTVRPRHIVLATGVFGIPRRPRIPGMEEYDGLLLHATDYRGAPEAENWNVLVVGSGSSAHDVAQDMQEAGAQVTMMQRSSTCVVSVEPGAARAYSIYRENGAPIDDCDLINNSFPLPLLAELHKELTERIAEMDRDLLEGLRAVGFALDFGEDGSGFLMKYHRSGGGYYINVGCSDLIVAGKIRVKHGVELARLTGRTAFFSDGTSMDVDMVVVAAGYTNMSESVRASFGDGVAERVGPVWGLDDEGEVRAMWKRTGQEGLWITGGSLQQCRPNSKYLALQIKGREEGLVH